MRPHILPSIQTISNELEDSYIYLIRQKRSNFGTSISVCLIVLETRHVNHISRKLLSRVFKAKMLLEKISPPWFSLLREEAILKYN